MSWIDPRLARGETLRVLTGIPGKTGVVYTLDRETGEFLWARPDGDAARDQRHRRRHRRRHRERRAHLRRRGVAGAGLPILVPRQGLGVRIHLAENPSRSRIHWRTSVRIGSDRGGKPEMAGSPAGSGERQTQNLATASRRATRSHGDPVVPPCTPPLGQARPLVLSRSA